MGYIITILAVVILVPLLFLALSRRPTGPGGLRRRPRDRGVTVSQPSSDQPSPGTDDTLNQTAPGAERRIPPG